MGRLAVMLGLFAACFSPKPQAGAECANGKCPSGLVCRASTNTCEVSDDVLDDASASPDSPTIDSPVTVMPDARACFGSGIVQICPTAPVTQPFSVVNSTTIDTDTSPSCVPYTGPSGFCVIAGTTVTISTALNGRGTKPLVVLATDTLQISAAGAINVASLAGQPAGAGANAVACVAGTPAAGQQGAPGGSFSGVGGRGADLENANGPTAAAATAMPVTTLRGGCRGGAGSGASVTPGGNGGGAVAVIAANAITIFGTVNASGGGGNGAVDRSGGGGGGTGGMIVLDAPNVTVAGSGRIFANGGAGGEGGTANHDGNRGADPSIPTVAAAGGLNGAGHGGDGGAGTTGANRNGVGGVLGNQCTGAGGENGKGGGGGGGGGAAGVIRIFAMTPSLVGTVSPPAN